MTNHGARPAPTIARGEQLSDGQRSAAVEIVYEAFREKLHQFLLLTDSADKIKRVLRSSLDFSQSLVALRGEEVCGVMLFSRGNERYLRGEWPMVRREFGWWGGLYRLVRFWIVTRQSLAADELHIQALAVGAGFRSQGIGAKLVSAAEAYAHENGCRTLSLEVIDNNPRARQLYERLGFVAERTESTWPFTRSAGFESYDYMVKRGASSPRQDRPDASE